MAKNDAFDREMQAALHADGEKLRALTREDHGPWPVIGETKHDIVDILAFWEGRDDVPEELNDYLANAADEIRGLRLEIKDLRKELDSYEPRF